MKKMIKEPHSEGSCQACHQNKAMSQNRQEDRIISEKPDQLLNQEMLNEMHSKLH
ncbi:MAG: hypothetical protein GZ093_19915 [Rhodoferax sp.]|uniref:hypothetical protein n=1 Tax=Rhodoferax sp. TaxID=50421 RepID=UPI0013FEDB59|nr:hypothetical protein [Rhodoferax sp.]NDP40959.1 hypothetical protein [Rhodoferax sp.]